MKKQRDECSTCDGRCLAKRVKSNINLGGRRETDSPPLLSQDLEHKAGGREPEKTSDQDLEPGAKKETPVLHFASPASCHFVCALAVLHETVV